MILHLQLWDFFSKRPKNKFETAVVNEPSVFEPLKFYCMFPLRNKESYPLIIHKPLSGARRISIWPEIFVSLFITAALKENHLLLEK